MVSRVVGGTVPRFDIHDSGPGRITGTTRVVDLPDPTPVAPRRVRLHDQRSGRLIQEVWSEAGTGAYAFTQIRMGVTYYVIAFDHTGQYSGVIETDVLPELPA